MEWPAKDILISLNSFAFEKRMDLVLSSPEWTDSLLSMNHLSSPEWIDSLLSMNYWRSDEYSLKLFIRVLII